MSISYIAIKPNEFLNFEVPAPIFKCGIICDTNTSNDFKNTITDYLYTMGCRYLCAWGNECSIWDDAMDWTSLDKHDYDIPDDEFCMTTWHENEPVEEMLFFLKTCATTYLEGDIFQDTLILYIGEKPNKDNILQIYEIVEDLD